MKVGKKLKPNTGILIGCVHESNAKSVWTNGLIRAGLLATPCLSSIYANSQPRSSILWLCRAIDDSEPPDACARCWAYRAHGAFSRGISLQLFGSALSYGHLCRQGRSVSWSNCWRQHAHCPSSSQPCHCVASKTAQLTVDHLCSVTYNQILLTQRWWHRLALDFGTFALDLLQNVLSGLLGTAAELVGAVSASGCRVRCRVFTFWNRWTQGRIDAKIIWIIF